MNFKTVQDTKSKHSNDGSPLRTQRDPLCPDMQAWESGLYSTVVIWSRSFGHFRFRERGYLLTIYKIRFAIQTANLFYCCRILNRHRYYWSLGQVLGYDDCYDSGTSVLCEFTETSI